MKMEQIDFEKGLDIPGLDGIIEDEFLSEAKPINDNQVELHWMDGTTSMAVKIGNDWSIQDLDNSLMS